MVVITTTSIRIKRGRPPKNSLKSKPETVYKCVRCGSVFPAAEGKFYKTPNNEIFEGNENFSHICSKCINEIFEYFKIKFNDQELATIICCHYVDIPFYRGLYNSINMKNDNFTFGKYLRHMNGGQYKTKSFVTTLIDGELSKDIDKSREETEENWSLSDRRNKNETISIVGYDPFIGYADKDRKYLFAEILKWLDDDDLLDDTYKMTQVIQIVNNNNQIKQCDIAISRLDPVRNLNEVKTLNAMKKDLVMSNDKIAKENGISVKNRSDQKAGRNTLTGLMRDMREKDLNFIEVNFYNQLRSESSRWAAEVSSRALKENCYFDENDINDIIDYQNNMLSKLQLESEDLKESNRILKLQCVEYEELIKKLENRLKSGGGVNE